MDVDRLRAKRGDRRWFLGLTGAAAGAAGLAAAGCGGGSKKGSTPGATSDGGSTSTAKASTTGTASGDKQQGETLRYTGYVASDGVYDPHKTQAGPFYGQQSLVMSRLLTYQSQTDGIIMPDLALAKPETPDGQTLVFRLNPAARWHEREPLNGRQVTADDVKFSFERQMQGDGSFIRKAQWANIDKIEATDPQTVTFHMKAPLAAMVERFADVNAFIVAPELVANGRGFDKDAQVGSGPFRWVEWNEGQFASVARNPKWFGQQGHPFLDGVTVTQPKDSTEVEAKLRTKGLDVAFVGRPTAEKLKKAVPALQESTVGRSLFFGMRFFVQTAPFNDPRFRAAMSMAVDRRDMLVQFFAGSGDVNPWVSWPIKRWSLPQNELATAPGYRQGEVGRAQDITEAKAQLAAYTNEKKLPDAINLFVLDDAESTLKMGSVIRDQIRKNLELPITVYPVSIKQLTAGMLSSEYTWAAAPDIGWVDLDDWVFPYFHSAGTKNTFALRDADLDKLIESQRIELNESTRRDIGFQIQRRLLQLNAGVNFVSETVVALRWPYVRDFPLDAADGYQHRFADTWIDRSEPSFKGR